MAQTIKLKRSGTQNAVPTTSQLALGEVALNTYDGKMYIKKSVGGTESIVEIGGDATSSSGLDFTGNLNLADDVRIVIGDGNDLQIFHDGSHSYIKELGTGNLRIDANDFFVRNAAATQIKIGAEDGGAVKLYYAGVKKFETTSTGATVTGTLVANSLNLGDNEAINIGTSDDFQIFHNGSNSIIKDAGIGNLSLQTNGSTINMWNSSAQNYIGQFNANAVTLYHGGNEKFKTTSSGVTVTGTMLADEGKLTGSGFTTFTVNSTRTSGNIGGMNFTASNTLKGQIFGSVEGELKFAVNGSTEAMRIDADGRLLVNTTSSIDNLAKIQVMGDSSSLARITLQDVDGTNQRTFFEQSGGGTRISTQDGTSNGIFTIGAWNGTASSDFVRVTSTGRVGIGTVNPEHPLHVSFSGDNGAQIKSTDNHASLYINAGSGYGSYIRFEENNAQNYWINADTNGRLLFRPGGGSSNWITFDSNGRIGIGTTAPSNPLHVVGDALVVGTLAADELKVGPTERIYLDGGSNTFIVEDAADDLGIYVGGSRGLRVNTARTVATGDLQVAGGDIEFNQSSGQARIRNLLQDTYLRFQVNVGGTQTNAINIRGNNAYVGIGGASVGNSPTNPLDVYNASADTIARFTSGDNKAGIQISDDDTDVYVIAEGSKMGLGTVNALSSSNLTIDASGNVGIGTTTPGEKLEVIGNVEAEEFIGDIRGATLFKASAGEALSKGDVVYISGISGNTTVVSKADADDANKMPAFGIAAAAASANNPVDVYTSGILSGIDTSSFSEGDELFVSTTAGVLTATPPTGESAALQKIGKVTRSASSGSIFIIGAGRSNATPNLNEGKLFVGNSSNQAVADDTVHVDIANSRVGIGTTSPDTNLDITSEGVQGLILNQDSSNSSASSRIFLKSAQRINTILNVSGNTEFRTGATIGSTSGTVRLTINGSTGNAAFAGTLSSAGTGTSSFAGPLTVGGTTLGNAFEFQVNGDARITGFVEAGSAQLGNTTLTGFLRGPSTFTIDPAAHGDDTGTVVIAGNLQVDGTTTTINSTTLTVDDKNITLASGSINKAAANGAGLTVDCGSDTDATFTYNGTNDQWELNKILKWDYALATTALHLNNNNIVGVNNISFADPGGNEGLQWTNIKVFESPNDLSNTSGNFQVTYGGTRRLTVDNTGIDVVGKGKFRGSADGASVLELGQLDNDANTPLVTVYTDDGGSARPFGGDTLDFNTARYGQQIGATRGSAAGGNVRSWNFGTTTNGDERGIDLFIYSQGDSSATGSTGTSINVQLSATSNRNSYINTGGNFGLGTAAPTHKLHVASTSPSLLLQKSDETGRQTNISHSSGLTKIRSRNNSTNGQITFEGYTSSTTTEYARFDASGKLGIGTTSPSQKLSVNGNIYSIGGFVNASGYQLNGTYVVDSSRNLVNIGTISSSMIQTTGSRIAIGNTSHTPNDTLDIKASGPGIRLTDTQGGSRAVLTNDAGTFKIVKIGNEPVQILTNGSERFSVEVGGAIRFNDAFTFPTTDGSANQILKTDGSGNVTWATEAAVSANTSISDADGDTKIQVEESADEDLIRFDAAGTERFRIGSDVQVLAATDFNITGANRRLNFTSGTGTIRVTGASSLHLATNNTNRVTVDSSGNVGIGTTSPSQKLQVAGTILADTALAASSGTTAVGIGSESNITEGNSTYKTKLITENNNAKLTTYQYGSYLTLKAGTSGSGFANNWSKIELRDGGSSSGTTSHMKFYTSGDQRMVINDGGNVGIGTTAPSYLLHVDAAVSTDPSYIVASSATNFVVAMGSQNSPGVGQEAFVGTLSNDDLKIKSNNTERIRVKADGNVGIGTSSPSAPLHLKGTGDTTLIVEADSDNTGETDNARIELRQDGNNVAGYLYTEGNAGQTATGTLANTTVLESKASGNDVGIHFATGGRAPAQSGGELAGTVRMTVLGSGKVGVGTTSPTGLFEVYTSATRYQAFRGNADLEIVSDNNTNPVASIKGTGSSDLLNVLDNTTNVFTIKDGGNVGIGIASPTKSQHLYYTSTSTNVGAEGLAGGSAGKGLLIQNAGTASDSYANLDFRANNADGRIAYQYKGTTNVGDFHFITDNTNAPQTMLFIKNNGPIGLGTTVPGSRLQVGSATADSSNYITFGKRVSSGESNLPFIGHDSKDGTTSDLGLGARSTSGQINFYTGNNAAFTAARRRMIIDANGRLIIAGSGAFTVGGNAQVSVSTSVNSVYLTAGSSNSDLIYSRRQGVGHFISQAYNSGNTGTIELNPYGGNVGIGTGNTVSSTFQVEDLGIDTTTTTTSATTQVAIDTMAAATFRSAEFTIQVTNSTDSTYHLTKVLLIHDGTTPGITEYGTVFTGSAAEATFNADISSGNVRLLATPASTDSMTFKVVRHCITV